MPWRKATRLHRKSSTITLARVPIFIVLFAASNSPFSDWHHTVEFCADFWRWVCQDKYCWRHAWLLLEILRAAKILHAMERAHATEKGAVGLEGEMIDAPMLKQVWHTNTTSFGSLNYVLSGRKDHTVCKGSWFADSFRILIINYYCITTITQVTFYGKQDWHYSPQQVGGRSQDLCDPSLQNPAGISQWTGRQAWDSDIGLKTWTWMWREFVVMNVRMLARHRPK